MQRFSMRDLIETILTSPFWFAGFIWQYIIDAFYAGRQIRKIMR